MASFEPSIGTQANERYQICTRCVMDTSDPEISFDVEGVCSHCRRFDAVIKPQWHPDETGERLLAEMLGEIKADGKAKDYDCIMGLSGGVDSSYLAYLASEWGLRILAVHVDGGWNSELAVQNIEQIVNKLDIHLFTHVVNWKEMKDLQRSFLISGVANQDVPQDHVFFAVLYKTAHKMGIRHILTGSNFATECILPTSWGYDAMDAVHLRAIQKRFGTMKLKDYVIIGNLQYQILRRYVWRQRLHKPLNYLPYDKVAVKEVLQEKLGWVDYGLKHGESRFTKVFQNWWLPRRFGYDKRRAHLASMINSGSITRDEALKQLEQPPYVEEKIRNDVAFFAKKLGFTVEELEVLIKAPLVDYTSYPSTARWINAARKLKHLFSKKG